MLPQITNYYIIKWAGAVLRQGLHHCVIHHWTADIFSILTRCVKQNNAEGFVLLAPVIKWVVCDYANLYLLLNAFVII